MKCGELCTACVGQCYEDGRYQDLQVECSFCNGTGKRRGEQCQSCESGQWTISGCPKEYAREVVAAVNLAGFAGKGILPLSGGTLDQSAWFMDLWQTLETEVNQIDQERAERARKRYG